MSVDRDTPAATAGGKRSGATTSSIGVAMRRHAKAREHQEVEVSEDRPGNFVGRRAFLATASAAGLAACAGVDVRKPSPATAMPRLTILFDQNAMSGPRFLSTWMDHAKAAPAGLAAATLNRVDRDRTNASPFTHVLQLDFGTAQSREAFIEEGSPSGAFPADSVTMKTAETVIRPVSADQRTSAKRIGLVGRAPDKAKTDFVREWRDIHAPEVDRQPGLAGYSIHVASPADPWDGYAELWWPTWDIYVSATRFRLAQPSTRGFFHRRLLLLVEELYHKRFAS